MKIIASNGENILIDSDDKWICISPYSPKSEIIKKDDPKWYESAVQKWGYVPLKNPIEGIDLSDITGEIYKKALNSLKWEKDYIT